jgi:ADP-heptose:LPS heptosyltransferase
LVLRPGALGDTLLAVPALRALRRTYPRLTLGAHGGAARLLVSTGEVDAGFAFDDPSFAWLFRQDSEAPDDVVAWTSATNMPGLTRASVIAASRPPEMDRHCARYLLETLAPLGINLDWDDAPLRVTPIPSLDVLVHPGSGSPAKNWPAERFARLIDGLDAPVRLVVGEADATCAARVEACLGYAVPRLEHPALEDLAARLAGSRGYVGNDSGVSHLAGLCGARTIALFGPSDATVWRPIGPDVHVVSFEAEPEEIAGMLRG